MSAAVSTDEPATRPLLQTALVLASVALLSRLACLAVLPRDAISLDLKHWTYVASMLERGENPYVVSTYLNWPPLWMQLVALLNAVSRLTSIPLSIAIRLFLVAADVINILLALRIATKFTDLARARRALLWGLALNPVALFLVCQHGNFDVLVATALLVFALALVEYRRTPDVVQWLIAAFALGIGILVKTVPLLIAPLLTYRISRIPRAARILGLLLVVTPAAIGMSIIYVLAPHAVTVNVLQYRSYAGWFGISGLALLLGYPAVMTAHAAAFPLIALAGLVLIARWLVRTELRPEQIVLLIGTLLLAVITFGPGYAAQYLSWPLPFFAITLYAFDDQWRRDLVVVWIVTIVIYTIEYLLIVDQGQLLLAAHPTPTLRHIRDVLDEDGVKTLLRLPLFAAYAWVVFAASVRLKRAAAGPVAPAE